MLKDRASLQAEIDINLADNTSGDISEQDVRDVATNLNDSNLNKTNDLVDNLTSTDTDKALSANQGRILQAQIDGLDPDKDLGVLTATGFDETALPAADRSQYFRFSDSAAISLNTVSYNIQRGDRIRCTVDSTAANTPANWEIVPLSPEAIAVPDATEIIKGIARIATEAEVLAGTDDTKSISPKKLTVSQDSDRFFWIVEGATDFTTAEPAHSPNKFYVNTTQGNGSTTTATTFIKDAIYKSDGTEWAEFIPVKGWKYFDKATEKERQYNGTEWKAIAFDAEWVDISTTATLAPGKYKLAPTVASPFTVTLENVRGEWEFADPNFRSTANALTIGTAANTFTDETGDQVAGPYVVQQDGFNFKLVGDGANNYYVVHEPAATIPPIFIANGGWDASTNAPDLTQATNQGDEDGNTYTYLIVATGTQDLGSGSQFYETGGEITFYDNSGTFRYDPPSSKNHVFIPETAIAPATTGNPTIAEITAYASSNNLRQTHLLYTATDSNTDTIQKIYHIDAAGSAIALSSQDSTLVEPADNFIRAGSVVVTNDNDQTFSFDTPFNNADGTTDADIVVLTTRTLANIQFEIPVTATTLTGFTVNRDNSIDGSEPMSYIAVNKNALAKTVIRPEDALKGSLATPNANEWVSSEDLVNAQYNQTLYSASQSGGVGTTTGTIADLGFVLQNGDEILLQLDIGLAMAVWQGTSASSNRLENPPGITGSNTFVFTQSGTNLQIRGNNTNGSRQWLKIRR